MHFCGSKSRDRLMNMVCVQLSFTRWTHWQTTKWSACGICCEIIPRLHLDFITAIQNTLKKRRWAITVKTMQRMAQASRIRLKTNWYRVKPCSKRRRIFWSQITPCWSICYCAQRTTRFFQAQGCDILFLMKRTFTKVQLAWKHLC